MSEAELTTTLNQAAALIKAGQLDEARRLLLDLSARYPESEALWMWLSAATPDRDQRVEYLRRALAINPANEKARAALTVLLGEDADLPPIPPAPAAPPQSVTTESVTPAAVRGGLAAPITMRQIETVTLVVLGILAVFVLVLLGGNVLMPILNPPTPTPTPTATFTPSLTFTPGPTREPPATLTLPPSWTPAPSITARPTRTAVPTMTPRASSTASPTRTLVATIPPPASPTPTMSDTPTPELNTAEPIRPPTETATRTATSTRAAP